MTDTVLFLNKHKRAKHTITYWMTLVYDVYDKKKLLTDVNRLFWRGYLWERKSPYKQILKFKGHFQFYINLQIIIFVLGFLCFWPRAFMRKVLKSALLFLLGVANFFHFPSYIVIICQDFVLFRQESIVRMENTFL